MNKDKLSSQSEQKINTEEDFIEVKKSRVVPQLHEIISENIGDFKHQEERFHNEPQWHSQKQLDGVQNKENLARLLMSLQLHKMGFTFPQYENEIKNYLQKSNLEDVPLKQIAHWISQQKTEVIHVVLPEEFSHFKPSSVISKKVAIEGSSIQFQSKQEVKLICSICFEVTANYEHRECPHNFCNQCIRYHILQNIDSANYEIRCPMYNCQNDIEEFLLQKLLKPTEYERFTYFREKAKLEKNPMNKFCSQPDCGELLITTFSGSLKCPKCQIEFCQVCLQIVHPETPCDKKIIKALKETYEKFRIKKCPKCSAPIQKIDGCNHMVCKKCKAEFCWICLSLFSIHHYQYYNCCGCPGLQFGEEEDLPRQKCKQAIIFIFLPLIITLVIATYFLSLPFYILFCLITKPCEWIKDEFDVKCQKSVLQKACFCFHNNIKHFFMYLAFIPRSVMFALFMAPVKLLCFFCNGTHDFIV